MGKKLSELGSLSEVTNDDLFMITDDTTGASKGVTWSNIKSSIPATALDDVSDVDLTTAAPADGSALVYDSASSKWIPGEASDIEGHNPQKGITYKYQSSVSAGPGAGSVRFNSNVPAGTNVMYIRDTDQDGIDHTSILSTLFQQNTVFVFRSNSNTSHYVKFAVSGHTTDFGNYFVVPVRHIESSSYPSNNSHGTFTNVTQLYSLEAAQDFTLSENTASAIDFKQGDDSYIKIDTSSSSKKITIGQDITFSGDVIDTLTLKSDTANSGSFRVYQGDNSTDAPDLRLYKSRGSTLNPSTITASDAITRISAYAYDGAQYIQCGNIGFLASDGDGNGNFEIRTRVGDTLASRLVVDSSGDTEVKGELIQNPSSSVTPADNGQLTVEATSNTTLTFKLKGSDGTVRSGTITLS